MDALQTLDALLAFEEQEMEARAALEQARGRDKSARMFASQRRQIAVIRLWVAALRAGKAEAPGARSRGAEYFNEHGKLPLPGEAEVGTTVAAEVAGNPGPGRQFHAVLQREADELARRVLGGVKV